jgi:hypothetical protein
MALVTQVTDLELLLIPIATGAPSPALSGISLFALVYGEYSGIIKDKCAKNCMAKENS